MSPSTTVRLSGMAMVVGAVVVFVTTLIGALVFVGANPSAYANGGLYTPVNLIGFFGLALVLVGLPATFVAWDGKLGTLGVVGVFLIFVTGLMFGVFFNLFSALFVPYIVQHAPNLLNGNNGPAPLLPFFIAGSVGQVVGCVLLAIQILRGFVSQRWVAIALILSAVMQVVSFLTGGSAGNVLLSLINSLNVFLLLAALGGIGYELWSGSQAVAPQQQTVGVPTLP